MAESDQQNPLQRLQQNIWRSKMLSGSPPNQGRSICEELTACTICGKRVAKRMKDPAKHHCGQTKCKTCGVYYKIKDGIHQCFMIRMKNLLTANGETWESEDDNDDKDNSVEGEENVLGMEEDDGGVTKKNVKKSIYYFDTEAESSHEHNCNCICVKKQDGSDERVFYGDTAVAEFVEWMLELKHVIFIAHNFSGYDGYFIMKGLVDKGICPSIIPRGGKILSLQIKSKE